MSLTVVMVTVMAGVRHKLVIDEKTSNPGQVQYSVVLFHTFQENRFKRMRKKYKRRILQYMCTDKHSTLCKH